MFIHRRCKTVRWGHMMHDVQSSARLKPSTPVCLVDLVIETHIPGVPNSFGWIRCFRCVCVCILLKQTGSIRSTVNAWNAGGQSSLMLLCPTKLRIREGSIHWPWMCTCKHVLTMLFCVNESCDHSFTLLLVSIMRYDLFVMYGDWAKPQTQRAESCSLRTL